MTPAIRVLLVEDNEVYRATLELLLAGRAGIEIVGSVADGGEAAAAAERLDPDVVLMDFRLPGLDGAQATARRARRVRRAPRSSASRPRRHAEERRGGPRRRRRRARREGRPDRGARGGDPVRDPVEESAA